MSLDSFPVKAEPQMCGGCLSTARRTSPISHLRAVLAMLTPHLPWDSTISFCWECVATFRRIQRFQSQLQHAHEMLAQMVQINLSALTISSKDFYDQDIHYSETNDRTCHETAIHIKEESSDSKIEIVNKFHKSDIEKNYDIFDKNDDIEKNYNIFDKNDDSEKNDSIFEKNYDVFDKNDDIEKNYNLFDKNADFEKNDSIFEKNYDVFDKNDDTDKNGDVTDDNVGYISDDDEKHSKKTTNGLKLTNKQKLKIQNRNIKMEYKSYARIQVRKWEKPYSQYYTEVELDEKDVEYWFLKKDRKRQGHKMKHRCEDCSLIYLRKLDLDRHNNLNHHKKGTPYRCLHCGVAESSLAALSAHWRSHSLFYRCALCTRCVFGNSMALHLSRSHVNNYQCTNCTRGYGSLRSFTEHYKKFHRFVCDYCNKRCAMRSALEKHIRNHHSVHRCAECARTFPSRRAHLAHRHAAHRAAPPDLAYCVECDAQFLTRHAYMRHVSAKHSHKPARTKQSVCPECGKGFNKNHDMLRHYDFAHKKVTDYHCQLCDKYFLKSYGLRTHTESVHLKLPKHKNKICDICGRAFHGASVLKNHRRTHTGERPFQCQFCLAAFAQKGAMVIHQRKQHGG